MKNLGAAMAGGLGERRAYDFYPTPWEATEALLREVKFPVDIVWEPACGDGAIMKVLEAHGYEVFGTDIQSGVDFLDTGGPTGPATVAGAIITNPPFKLAKEFILKALEWVPICAFLLKANYFNAAARLNVPLPSRVLPLTFRIDVTGAGNPTMDVSWYVWGVEGTPFKPLPKPTRPDNADALSLHIVQPTGEAA